MKTGNGRARPPKTLSKEAAAWWTNLVDEYALDDQAALLLLETAMLAFDRMNAARRAIAKEGMTFKDRWGQRRVHPLLAAERDARQGMLAALRALHLDVEPLRDGPGRPGGSKVI